MTATSDARRRLEAAAASLAYSGMSVDDIATIAAEAAEQVWAAARDREARIAALGPRALGPLRERGQAHAA